jgi:methylglutaconyl-CoA hydratase
MAAKEETLIIEYGAVTTVKLNRPHVHNAMNTKMMEELTAFFLQINNEKKIKLVIIQGEGKSFCAGADLNYMKNIATFGYDKNYEDALKIATLIKAIYECHLPTLAVVHGSVYGGANGLISACDIVLAEDETTFAFSEVKLGIAPATIAPSVIKRIGEFNAKHLMLSGRKFGSIEAKSIGLVTSCHKDTHLSEAVEVYKKEFESSAPEAVRDTKELIAKVTNQKLDIDEEIKYTSKCIAKLRQGDEGQEGMSAFLEKRRPKWNKDS